MGEKLLAQCPEWVRKIHKLIITSSKNEERGAPKGREVPMRYTPALNKVVVKGPEFDFLEHIRDFLLRYLGKNPYSSHAFIKKRELTQLFACRWSTRNADTRKIVRDLSRRYPTQFIFKTHGLLICPMRRQDEEKQKNE